MPSPFKSLLSAATLYISFLCVLVTASPIDTPAQPHSPNHSIQPRQDPTDNTVGAEDETAAEIAADGTGPLRSGKSKAIGFNSRTNQHFNSGQRTQPFPSTAHRNLVSSRRAVLGRRRVVHKLPRDNRNNVDPSSKRCKTNPGAKSLERGSHIRTSSPRRDVQIAQAVRLYPFITASADYR